MADEHLFEFIFSSVCWFDECAEGNVNFHLAFLLKLSRFLGFAPSTTINTDHLYFDLQEGEFKSRVPGHPYFLNKEDASLFIALYTSSFEKINEIKAENKTRRFVLDKILIYYTLHTASFGEIYSHQVLEEVLS